jgi:hypothetical protein
MIAMKMYVRYLMIAVPLTQMTVLLLMKTRLVIHHARVVALLKIHAIQQQIEILVLEKQHQRIPVLQLAIDLKMHV